MNFSIDFFKMRLRFAIILIIGLMLAGCKGRKAADDFADGGDIGAPLAEVFDSIGADLPNWQCLYAPLSIELQTPAQFSISGRATLVRDSLLYVSLRKMGMEVAVLRINSDSAFFLDKYHKLYVAEPLSALVPDALVTLPQVQSLLLGRPFPASGLWFGTVVQSPEGAPAMGSITLLVGADNQLDFNYFDVSDTECGPMPGLLQLLAFTPKMNAAANITWQLDKAKWTNVKIPDFKLPANYNRIDGADLIRALANQ